LQNSERRYDRALHHKVDALAIGLVTVMRQQGEADREERERMIRKLCAAVGVEERM
jgi:hypothetical protein